MRGLTSQVFNRLPGRLKACFVCMPTVPVTEPAVTQNALFFLAANIVNTQGAYTVTHGGMAVMSWAWHLEREGEAGLDAF